MTAPDMSAIRDRAIELVEMAPAAERLRAERRVARLFGVRRRTVHRWASREEAFDNLSLHQDPGEPALLVTARTSTKVIAMAALLLAGLGQGLIGGATTGLVAVVVLAPVWWSALRFYPWARTLLTAVGGVLLSAAWLAAYSSSDHEHSIHNAMSGAFVVVAGFGSVGLILWARRFLPLSAVALSYGAGSFLTAAQGMGQTPNPWKFGIAIPTATIVLAVLQRFCARATILAALLALGTFSILNDYRSYMGFCVLAGTLVVYQGRPNRLAGEGKSTPSRVARQLLTLAALGLGAYFAISSLLVQGYLGADAALRTRAQIEESGSLISGGRPEWNATFQLMQDRPEGYGLGVVPNSHDIAVGKSGLDPLNIPTIDGYAEHYMFGGQFKLHSVIADLWTMAGIPGLLLGLTLLAFIAAMFSARLTMRAAPALILFTSLSAFWNLGFSPIYSSLDDIALALGLVWLPGRLTDRSDSATPVVTSWETEPARAMTRREFS